MWKWFAPLCKPERAYGLAGTPAALVCRDKLLAFIIGTVWGWLHPPKNQGRLFQDHLHHVPSAISPSLPPPWRWPAGVGLNVWQLRVAT